jgi:pantoate--beta-alanine ligase
MVAVHETIASFRSALDRERHAGRTVGFVPTMGYLHEGHGSLMDEAGRRTDVVTASIFVNPLQFAANEDLSSYPRDLDRDLALCEEHGVQHVLHPSVDEMYPGGPVLTTVTVRDITARFEGAARPEHFAGVATVVAKLFSIVGESHACFGEKDFQQLAVVRRMAADLSMPVVVVGCPTMREPDGLAMSSRNVYLDDAQRTAAPVLKRALDAAAAAARNGATVAEVHRVMVDLVNDEPEAVLDYAELVESDTLEPAATVHAGQRLLIAARFGRTRLLDNRGIPEV